MPTLSEASALYVGGAAVSALYVGASKVWPAPPPTGPVLTAFHTNDYSAASYHTGYATVNAWAVNLGRLSPSTTGTTPVATYQTAAASRNMGSAWRIWRSTARGNATVRLRSAATPATPGANYLTVSVAFNTTTIEVREVVAGVSTLLGSLPYADGQLFTFYAVGDTAYVQVDGGAVSTFPLTPVADDPAQRFIGYTMGTASPRWSGDDLTLYNIAP